MFFTLHIYTAQTTPAISRVHPPMGPNEVFKCAALVIDPMQENQLTPFPTPGKTEQNPIREKSKLSFLDVNIAPSAKQVASISRQIRQSNY
jgi:hypothetical protein